MILNKALVHKGSPPLVQMFFSDISKITVFQSLNAFPGKSKDEWFKVAWNNNPQESKTKHTQRFFYLFQSDFQQKDFIFCSMCRCPKNSLLHRMNRSSVQKFKLCLPLPCS